MDDFTDFSQFRIDDLLVIPERNTVIRDGKEIKLEPRMMQVLVMLAEHSGDTLSPERLLIDVWGCTADDDSPVYGDSSVSRAISLMRKALRDDSRKPRYIETVSKVGYRLIPPVSLPENYRRMPSERWTEGSPYVGLSAFDSDHASVFCGRSRVIADLLKAMRSQIDNQRRFVLIVGASGCGKTSLLRAGAIPLLTKPGGFEGLHAISVVTCDLAGNGRNPMIPLLEALAAWTVEDRPVFPPQTPEQLMLLLTETPAMIEGFVNEAFRRDPKRDLHKQPYAHLLLTVDHAEALVATNDIDLHSRDSFAQIVQALCACPHVVVTMIARGDFYHKLIEALPVLAEYKAGDGHLDVMAPRYGEIGEIIRSPAWKADLSFETHRVTRTRLDDELRDKALAQPDALPLLQHTLQTLYERRNDQRQLTFAAYDDIGGLEGAIAHQAEKVFASLPITVQTSLNSVLARLVVMQPGSEVVTARRARIDALSDDARILVEAFIRGRLFVSEMHDSGPRFGVVHEALLRQWPRASKWTQRNWRQLQSKGRFKRAAYQWAEGGKNADHLLNSERLLMEAEEVASEFKTDLSKDEHDFLRASQKFYYRKLWLKRTAVSTLAALTIATTILATVAMQMKIQAEKNRKKAIDTIGYNLVDLAEELRPTASIHSLDGISTHAINLIETMGVEEMSTDDFINYSRALRIRGEVLYANGRSEEALELFKKSDDAAQKAAALGNNSERSIFETAQTAYWLGESSKEESEKKYHRHRYSKIADELLKIDPNNPYWMTEKSFSLNTLGAMQRDESRCDEAIPIFEESLKYKQTALKNAEKKITWEYESIVTSSNINRCLASQGQIVKADKGYSENIESLRGIIELRPDAIKWRRQMASLLHFNAITALDLGNLRHAEWRIAESIYLLRILTNLQPSSIDWKRGLVNALVTGSEISLHLNDEKTAINRLQEASQIIVRQKTSGLPKNWQKIDAVVRFMKATIETDRLDETTADAAITDLEHLASQEEEPSHLTATLANALLSRGILLVKLGHRARAENDWHKVIDILGRHSKTTKDPAILAPWMLANCHLGRDHVAAESKFQLQSNRYNHPVISSCLK